MLWRNAWKKTSKKKAKDMASSKTASQGDSDVGDEKAGLRAASAPGPGRRKRKNSSDIALDVKRKNTHTYKNDASTAPAISSPPSMPTADTPSHPTPTNTEEEPPKKQ
eukprot:4652385-Ditylum_brightwellii.AAC.1